MVVFKKRFRKKIQNRAFASDNISRIRDLILSTKSFLEHLKESHPSVFQVLKILS